MSTPDLTPAGVAERQAKRKINWWKVVVLVPLFTLIGTLAAALILDLLAGANEEHDWTMNLGAVVGGGAGYLIATRNSWR